MKQAALVNLTICMLVIPFGCAGIEGGGGNARVEVAEVVGIAALEGKPRATALLRRDGMVIADERSERIYDFYAEESLLLEDVGQNSQGLPPRQNALEVLAAARGRMLPPFVTVDSLLYAYDRIYNDSLLAIEVRQAKRMKAWHMELWEWAAAPEPMLRFLSTQELQHLKGMIAVGRKLCEPEWKIPVQDLPKWVEDELALVLAAERRAASQGWRRTIDYTVFNPTGFYAEDESLEPYFRARKWWSHCPFRLDNDLELRMAAELAISFPGRSDLYYDLLGSYFSLLGPPEDPSLGHLARAVLLSDPTGSYEGDDNETLAKCLEMLKADFVPAIRVGDTPSQLTRPGQIDGVYALPSLYTFGSHVLTLTTRPPDLAGRFPSGLDVMAALDGDFPMGILLEDSPVSVHEPLKAAIEEAKAAIGGPASKIPEVPRQQMEVLKTLIEPKVTGEKGDRLLFVPSDWRIACEALLVQQKIEPDQRRKK